MLRAPGRHFPIEVEEARVFAEFAGRRVLFAGLIFTLVDIARAISAGLSFEVCAALPVTMSAALYALIGYYFLFRAGHRAAAELPGEPRMPDLRAILRERAY